MAEHEAKQKVFREWAYEKIAQYNADKEAKELKSRQSQNKADYVDAVDLENNLFKLTPEQIVKANEVIKKQKYQRK